MSHKVTIERSLIYSSNIRKNQRQVNINGNTVGSNRPDVQWDYNGVHHILEVDRTLVNNRKHKQIIELYD